MGPKPVTIIMIEDDEGHARLIEKNVRRAGVCNEIHHFLDAGSALRHLLRDGEHDHGPLLILLDLNLPDMNGIDVLAKIKGDAVLKLAPVIVLTTTDDRREIDRAYALGANVYITKPVDYEQFANAIRQLGLFLSVMQLPAVAK